MVEAAPGGVSGRTCSGVGGVPLGPAAPWGDGVGPGCVMGDVDSTLGGGPGSRVGTVLAAGSGACILAVVTDVVDAGAVDPRVGSGAVLARGDVGPLAVPVVGRAVDVWTVGPCVDTLSAGGLAGWLGGRAGRAVEGLCVPVGLLALAVSPAVVRTSGAAAVGAAVGVPGAAVGAEVRHVDAGAAGEGPPEAAGSEAPSIPVSVLKVLPAVAAGVLGSATRVPVVSVTGGTVMVPDVPLRPLAAVVTDAFWAELAVWLETKCP